MRILSVLLAALFLAVAPASAQEDGCTEADPCPLDLTVDEDGFSDQTEWNVTVGDWYKITLFNLDDASHVVTLSDYGTTLEAAFAEEDEATLQFTMAGDFFFDDDPSADQAVVHVLEVDAVAYEDSQGQIGSGTQTDTGTTAPPEDEEEGSPGAPLVLLLLLLAALAVAVRRRR